VGKTLLFAVPSKLTPAEIDEFFSKEFYRCNETPVLPEPLSEDRRLPAISYLLDNFFQAQSNAKKLYFPRFAANESVFIASDYGGDSGDSHYNTYSFVVTGWTQLGDFLMAQKNMRQTWLHPEKEISYKDLTGPLERDLDQYLANISNLVPGFVITIVIPKSIRSLFGGKRGGDPVS